MTGNGQDNSVGRRKCRDPVQKSMSYRYNTCISSPRFAAQSSWNHPEKGHDHDEKRFADLVGRHGWRRGRSLFYLGLPT